MRFGTSSAASGRKRWALLIATGAWLVLVGSLEAVAIGNQNDGTPLSGDHPKDQAMTSAQRIEAVRESEIAFAATMAERNLEDFGRFVAEEAVFFGDSQTLRGRQAIVEGWSAFFEGATAPFSWSPENVEVLPSGTLAHSSGPVLNAQGRRVATFNSIWRLEEDGHWRVVFDKGSPVCETE